MQKKNIALIIVTTIILVAVITILCIHFIKPHIKFPNLYYINLKHRVDRKKHLLKELTKINYPENKIIRVDAIYNNPGYIGCSKSHIKALQMAIEDDDKNDDNNFVIIMEDDFTFKPFVWPYRVLYHVFQSTVDWNVILLSCNKNTGNKYLQKVCCQTASGYIIKVKYIPTLLELWESDIKKENPPAIDQSWKQLQNNKWFITNPIIGKQMISYSDIECKIVNYGV